METENIITPGTIDTQVGGQEVPVNPEAVRKMMEPEINKLKGDIENSKKDLVTVLGIFASFITFVSVEFQLLKSIENISDYISLTLLLLSAMLMFVFGLKTLINDDIGKDFYKKPLFVISVSLMFLSIIFYSIPRMIHLSENKYSTSTQGIIYVSR